MLARCLLFSCCLIALLVLASAQPCIECQACGGSSNCLSVCQRECPKTVNLELCKVAGREAGRRVAKESCDLTQLYCRGGQQAQARFASFRVTLQQCGNAAFGECQRLAKDRWLSPCGGAFNGINQCSANAFQSFYNGEVDERCNKEADKIEKQGPLPGFPGGNVLQQPLWGAGYARDG